MVAGPWPAREQPFAQGTQGREPEKPPAACVTAAPDSAQGRLRSCSGPVRRQEEIGRAGEGPLTRPLTWRLPPGPRWCLRLPPPCLPTLTPPTHVPSPPWKGSFSSDFWAWGALEDQLWVLILKKPRREPAPSSPSQGTLGTPWSRRQTHTRNLRERWRETPQPWTAPRLLCPLPSRALQLGGPGPAALPGLEGERAV